MAVAFQSVNGTRSIATTATSAMPASIAAGDLLISELLIDSVDLTVTISAGWTIIHQANGISATYGVAYKIAAGSDTTPTWSWNGTSQSWSCNCSRLTGPYTGAGGPIGNKRVAVGNGTALACAAITAGSANAYMFSQNNAFNPSNQVVPLPTGYTSDSEFHSATGSERMSHKAITNVGDSSGATSVTLTSAKWAASLIEIRSQAPPVSRCRAIIIT